MAALACLAANPQVRAALMAVWLGLGGPGASAGLQGELAMTPLDLTLAPAAREVTLNNDNFFAPGHGPMLQTIVGAFTSGAARTWPRPDPAQYQPRWPLPGPAIVGNNFSVAVTGSAEFGDVIGHDAADIFPSDPRVDKRVMAPVSGLARVFRDLSPDQRAADVAPYHTAVAMMDERSGIVTVLLHIEPSAELFSGTDAEGFVHVSQGSLVGQVAQWPERPQLEVQHLHVMAIHPGPEEPRLLNPLDFMSDYRDTDNLGPTIHGIYIRDTGGAQSTLPAVPARTDLVVRVSDEGSRGFRRGPRHIAGSADGYDGGKWRPLWRLPRIDLAPLSSTLDGRGLIERQRLAFDLVGMAVLSPGEDWKGPERWDVVVTNLSATSTDRVVTEDRLGFVDTEGLRCLRVSVSAWDDAGNESPAIVDIPRAPEPPGDAEPSCPPAPPAPSKGRAGLMKQ